MQNPLWVYLGNSFRRELPHHFHKLKRRPLLWVVRLLVVILQMFQPQEENIFIELQSHFKIQPLNVFSVTFVLCLWLWACSPFTVRLYYWAAWLISTVWTATWHETSSPAVYSTLHSHFHRFRCLKILQLALKRLAPHMPYYHFFSSQPGSWLFVFPSLDLLSSKRNRWLNSSDGEGFSQTWEVTVLRFILWGRDLCSYFATWLTMGAKLVGPYSWTVLRLWW